MLHNSVESLVLVVVGFGQLCVCVFVCVCVCLCMRVWVKWSFVRSVGRPRRVCVPCFCSFHSTWDEQSDGRMDEWTADWAMWVGVSRHCAHAKYFRLVLATRITIVSAHVLTISE